MEKAQQLQQVHITVQGAKEAEPPKDATITPQLPILHKRNHRRWLPMILFTLFLLSGQSTATLLSRFYFNDGGKSRWMVALLQNAGFPILLFPLSLSHFFLNSTNTSTSTNSMSKNSPSTSTIALLYLFLGLLLGGVTLMYSYGLYYLPVSTYSLLCATQLAFNALFSFLLNSQKFTPFILNSLVLLTISATLLVVQPDKAESKGVPHGNFAIGFIFTLGASVAFSLLLSLTQLSFEKVLKKETFIVVLDLIIYQSLVATCVCAVGLFASGEWKGLVGEMDEFRNGKSSYVMTLVWTAVAWQVNSIGSVGLIFEVSSLFSNVISTFSLPLIPVLAVIFFHEKMDGVKMVAMLLAVWGFVSYIYQHYLDDSIANVVKTNVNEVLDDSCTE